jgi:hypothetical protein
MSAGSTLLEQFAMSGPFPPGRDIEMAQTSTRLKAISAAAPPTALHALTKFLRHLAIDKCGSQGLVGSYS